jgi:hypothetical protein
VRRDRRVVASTLTEAQDALWRQRPAKDADPQVWAAFHRHSAQVYTQTSQIDVRHRYEALQCAGLETRKAEDIEDQLASGGEREASDSPE